MPRCFRKSKNLIFALLLLIVLCQIYIQLPYWNIEVEENWHEHFSSPVEFLSLQTSEDGRHYIWPFVWNNTEQDAGEAALGIATQSSLSNIKDVLLLSQHWDGPVSLSVFLEGDQFPLFRKSVHHLARCYDTVRRKVSIHAVFPISRPPSDLRLDIRDPNLEDICSFHLNLQFHSNYDNFQVPYPVNLLRNVAISNLFSKYILLLDVDMVPSGNLIEEMKTMVLQEEFNALVLPAFERKDRTVVPRDKGTLVQMWEQGAIRPFYEQVCWNCQKYTMYERWKGAGSDVTEPYSVNWYDPWEPFYIALREKVVYDERFEQYGFNRLSQMCALHMSGFKFFVSQTAFIVHTGFKEKSTFHANKENEHAKNKLIYRKVKRELANKFPDSGRSC